MKKVIIENRKINIPEETMELFNTKYQHGDYKAILDTIKDDSVYLLEVSRALKSGKGFPVVVDAIVKYYNNVVIYNRIYDYNAE